MKKHRLTKFLIFIGISLSSLMISLQGYSQTGKITGKVTDKDDGLPLPGVTVKVKGTTNAAGTNTDGTYSINAAQGSTLIFSFIGYGQQEIAVPSSGKLDVALSKAVDKLNEVVVIGYGTARRKDLVSAVDVVSGKDAGSTSDVSPAQMLIGKAPGVQVINADGVPGSSVQIIIRGTGSFTDVSPLYIVDGIAGDINMVSPQDIENITILKDAASTAIYGVAGANGVVMVTTKKGKAGATQVSFTSQAGMSNVPKKFDLLNAAQYVKLLTDIDASNSLPVAVNLTKPYVLVDRTNWQNQIFQTAISTQNNVTVSGGSDKVIYNMSAGYVTQQPIVKGYQFNRFNSRFALEEKLGRFHFGETLNIRYTTTQGQTASIGNALQYAPYQPIYDATIPGGYSILTNENDNSNAMNPLQALGVQTENSSEMVLNPQVFGEVRILDGLTFRSQATASYGSSENDSYNIAYVTSNNLAFASQAGRSFSGSSNYMIENYLSYNHSFGKSNIALTAGTSYIDAGYYNTLGALGTGMLTDAVKNIAIAPTTAVNTNYSNYNTQFGTATSYYGRLIYSYDDKYTFSASIRRDGSSNFGPLSRYGNFPSAGFAWRFSQEDFIKSAFPFISDGKLRVGWGRLGNNRLNLFSYDVYTFSGSPTGNLVYSLGQPKQFVSGTTVTTVGNPLLHWESTDQADAGIDLGFLNNSITFTADYYNRKSSGLLVNIPLPPSLGIGLSGNGYSEPVNAADVQNRGFEFQLGYHSAVKSGFSYNVSVNGAFNDNKTLSLGAQSPTPIIQGSGAVETMTMPGIPIGAYYGYVVQGVASTQAQVDALNAMAQQKTGNPAAVYQAGLKPGDFIYKDLNGDGTLDSKDQKVLGSGIPKFMYGINMGATYKNFDLNVVLSGVQGVQIGNNLASTTEFAATGHNASTAILNRWEQSGDNAALPRAGQDDSGSGNLRPSSFFIDNGAYLRLRNLTLGYTLTKATLQSFSGNVLSKLRIYVAAENLLTITGYKGYDPEVGTSNANDTIFNRGIDNGQVPQPRTFLFGIQAGF
ncbi:MAG: SusC/RagA family TonB-linked outer membrane protein [Sphingobacteriales bacterium]